LNFENLIFDTGELKTGVLLKHNKSAKLTQNTHVVFVVNSIVMTTFLGAGFSIRYRENWQVIELGQDIMPTDIFTKFDKDRMKTV